jgi:glyoxylase-like metal-dependent hydrolase (beta-lactamase superfamily II)
VHIIALDKSDRVYSCNSYLILGDWNRMKDLDTVIDPGTDDFVLAQIERLSTGFGKVAVEQVVLTHNHFDHIGGVQALKQRYGARVLAFAAGPGVDELIRDGQFIRAGDGFLEVVHTPGHSSDSICLYAPQARAVFSGDTQLRVRGSGGDYPAGYLAGLQKLAGRKIECIYSGHDEPVTELVAEILDDAVAVVKAAVADFSETCRQATTSSIHT